MDHDLEEAGTTLADSYVAGDFAKFCNHAVFMASHRCLLVSCWRTLVCSSYINSSSVILCVLKYGGAYCIGSIAMTWLGLLLHGKAMDRLFFFLTGMSRVVV